jgi:carboxymethylenebutenolidase
MPNTPQKPGRVEAAYELLCLCGVDTESLSDNEVVERAVQMQIAFERFQAENDGKRRNAIAAVVDEHLDDEFVYADVDATMRTMVAEPYLNHVPVMTGGFGYEEVYRFYKHHFIGSWPNDTKVERISRTVGEDQVVDELVISFTHDVEMDALLPGVGPTHRFVELPHVVVMSFEGDKVSHEHIYWDQASLLAQVGLLDQPGLPIVGSDQATQLRHRSLPANQLMSNF